MVRAGRKRKTGRRLSNGHLVERPADYRILAAAQPHRAWLPESKRMDERADSILGCLNLIGKLTDEQAEAGRRYAVAVGRYRATIEGPSATSGSGRAYACNPLCDYGPDDCECHQRRKRYNDLYEALAGAGRKPMLAVNSVAIQGKQGDLYALRSGLDALVRHLGLTGYRKSDTRRN